MLFKYVPGEFGEELTNSDIILAKYKINGDHDKGNNFIQTVRANGNPLFGAASFGDFAGTDIELKYKKIVNKYNQDSDIWISVDPFTYTIAI